MSQPFRRHPPLTADLHLTPSGARDVETYAVAVEELLDLIDLMAGVPQGRVVLARLARRRGLDIEVPEVPEPPLGILRTPTQ